MWKHAVYLPIVSIPTGKKYPTVMIVSGKGFHQKIVDKIVQLFPPSRIGQRTGLILSDHIVRVYGALKFALLIKPVIGCISLCRIVTLTLGGEDTAPWSVAQGLVSSTTRKSVARGWCPHQPATI